LARTTGTFAALAGRVRTDGRRHVEFLARLVASQATADRDRRLVARMRFARFPYHRRLEDFDFDF
jgi:DNA replication protein DnaC